jgi:hypothetical protein
MVGGGVTIRAVGRYEQPLFADELPPLGPRVAGPDYWNREHDLNVRGARAPTSASKAGRLGHSRIPANWNPVRVGAEGPRFQPLNQRGVLERASNDLAWSVWKTDAHPSMPDPQIGGECRSRTCPTRRSRRVSTAMPCRSANSPSLVNELSAGFEPACIRLEGGGLSIRATRAWGERWRPEPESNRHERGCSAPPHRSVIWSKMSAGCLFGQGARARTAGLRSPRPALFQLSYTLKLDPTTGLEPASSTFVVSGSSG